MSGVVHTISHGWCTICGELESSLIERGELVDYLDFELSIPPLEDEEVDE